MLGIAFEGCACRAAFHAGVSLALHEAKLPIRIAAGASSGSIAAAAWATGREVDLPQRWASLADRSIVSWQRLWMNRSPFDMSHLVRSSLRDAFGAADFRNAPREAIVTTTELPTFRSRVFSSRVERDFVEIVLASCFFPILYGRPVRVHRRWMVDGGFRDNLPVEALVERGADEVICVTVSHDGLPAKSARRLRWRPKVSGATVHVIAPSRPLAMRSWDLSRTPMMRAIDEGYERGREFSRG